MPSSAATPGPSWPKNLAQLPLFKQVVGFLWLSLYIVTLLSLLSYDPADVGFNSYPPNPVPTNFIGSVGAALACQLFIGFGFGAYLFPLLFFWCCVVNFLALEINWRWKPLLMIPFLVSGCALLDLQHLGGWHLILRLANIDTPGYKAKGMDFEAEMRQAIAGVTNGEEAQPVHVNLTDGLLSRPDGNNVSMDQEGLTLAEAQLKFKTGVSLLHLEYQKVMNAIHASEK